ncbi:MAG: hypothetical protein PHR83_09380 [Paludibacter sp.]|nr:hypothetical protein [Paludibacter sp.]
MIIIEPFGGLANRMRVIASALWLQKKLDCEVTCVWSQNQDLNAEFDFLFEKIDGLNIKKKSYKFKYLKSTKYKKYLKLYVTILINKIIGIDYYIKEHDYLDQMWTDSIDIETIARKYKNIYIKTCEEFGDNYLEFQQFIPINSILTKMSDIVSQFESNTIGLHIRRTDNMQSIIYSPLELFIDTINSSIEKDENVNFFLSTDDIEVENELISKFGKRIIKQKKEFSRQSVVGMQDAVVDLFCLSKTSIIYGSYWSSFSDIASRIGRIDFISLKK